LLAGTISGIRIGDKGIITRYLKVCDDPICMMSSSCNSTHVSGHSREFVRALHTCARGKGEGLPCVLLDHDVAAVSDLQGSARGKLGDPEH